MLIGQLGKKAARYDPRTLKLSNYMHTALPPPPAEVSWVTQVPSWPMLMNSELGDCVCAGMGHALQQWSYYATRPAPGEIVMTDAQAIRLYEILGNYVPGDPSTDNGVVMLDAVKYWRNSGIVSGSTNAPHQIVGFLSLNPANMTEVFQAIQWFGNVFTGIALPITAQGADSWTMAPGGIYTDNGAPGSWGGHCVVTGAASPATLTCVTWGTTLKMSHNFWLNYVDECFVTVSPEWLIAASATAPSGLDLAQLTADLAAF